MKNLIEIEEDYVRSDLISAITVAADDDDTESAFLHVYLIGNEDPLEWWFEKRSAAETVRNRVAKDWIESLPA